MAIPESRKPGVPPAAGRGADASFERRPGVPMETPPHATPGARFVPLDQQMGDLSAQTGSTRRTPVFGTAQPMHGLSGVLKRVAYKIPEHRASHWMMLLLSDRVDVLESRLPKLLFGGAFVALGLSLASKRRR